MSTAAALRAQTCLQWDAMRENEERLRKHEIKEIDLSLPTAGSTCPTSRSGGPRCCLIGWRAKHSKARHAARLPSLFANTASRAATQHKPAAIEAASLILWLSHRCSGRQVVSEHLQRAKLLTVSQHVLPLAGLSTALALVPKRTAYAEEPVADPIKAIVSQPRVSKGNWAMRYKAATDKLFPAHPQTHLRLPLAHALRPRNLLNHPTTSLR